MFASASPNEKRGGRHDRVTHASKLPLLQAEVNGRSHLAPPSQGR
jgi:hypothetical protein